MTNKNVLIGSLLGAIFLLIATGCNTLRGKSSVEDYNADPLTVILPTHYSPAVVQNAMVKVLQNRGWAVISSSPNEVVGQLDHRGFKAKTMLVVSDGRIKILSDATYYVKNRDEHQPAVPYGWLENIQKDLNSQFARATY